MHTLIPMTVLLGSAVCGESVTLFSETHVAKKVVTLGDVSDLRVLPTEFRDSAAKIVVGRIPERAQALVLTSHDIQSRARAQMPLLAPWLGSQDQRKITVHYRAPRIVAQSCVRMIEPLAVGESVSSAKTAPAACSDKIRVGVFGYDRWSNSTYAIQPIAEGDVVRIVSGIGRMVPQAGDRMTLVSFSGPVVVERDVRAMQTANEGRRMFVETAEGKILSVRFESDANAKDR